MTSDKDNPDNAGLPPRDKAKRPHALLDLEATEVKPLGPEPAKALQDTTNLANEETGPAVSTVESTPDASLSEPEAGNEPIGTEPGLSGTPWPSRWRAFGTHAAAGLAGGIAALLFFAAFAPDLARRFAPTGASLAAQRAVERRLDTLEQAMPLPLSANVGEKLAAVEGRMAKIEETHARIAAETQALADRVGKQENASVETRLAKLEEQLAMLAAVPPAGTPAGPVPQLAAFTSKLADIEARSVKWGEASEEARAAAKEAAALKPDVARLDQLVAAVKAETGRNSQAVGAIEEKATALRSTLDGLAAGIEKQLQSTAKSGDIATAVTPLSSRLSALEQRLSGVVENEERRRASAERILLSLELARLKRAVDQGETYGRELDLVRKASAASWELAALDRFSDRGVSTLAGLVRDFRTVSHAILDAGGEPGDGSVIGQLMAGARSVVRVRKVDHDAGDTSVEAVVARMDKALENGRLRDVIDEAAKLPPRARASAREWLDKVEARHAIDGAIAKIEDQLESSLTNTGAPSPSRAE